MSTKLAQYRDPQLATTGEVIGFYEREFFVFSNFSSFQIEWKNRLWPTSEHAYQAAHFFETAPQLADEIFRARSAYAAFRLGKDNEGKVPSNWDKIKIDIMEDICRHKLNQNEYIQRKLLQTKDIPLIEDSPEDSFWGWGPDRKGRNELGKIWMRLRDELTNR